MNKKTDFEKMLLKNLVVPDSSGMTKNKKHLRENLILAHRNKSFFRMIDNLTTNFLKTMTKTQKTFAGSVLAIAIIFTVAGFVGPSADSVAHADAKEIVNRAFERMATLGEKDRASIENKFQERIQFKSEAHQRYVSLNDFSPEDLELKLNEMKLSLFDALSEAKNAPDLKVISADEMPVSGFLGRAGRTFGFKMTKMQKNFEEKIANLPDDICSHFSERREFKEEMMPTSFLVYTDSEGRIVTLGVNSEDEPVIKFVQPEQGVPPFGHGAKKPF